MLHLTACYMLHVTCYMCHVTCYMSHVICYMLDVICYDIYIYNVLLYIYIYIILYATCYTRGVINMLRVICYRLHATCCYM